MDATVNDFLNEINELVPLKENGPAWQECFDEQSGFHYYWNTRTNEVTWSKPDEYLPMKKISKSAPAPERSLAPIDVKIYKIAETKQAFLPKGLPPKRETKVKTKPTKVQSKFKKPSSDSEDEKIVLISSYGGDTESESEEEQVSKQQKPTLNTKNGQPEVQVTKKLPNTGAFSLVAGYSDSEDENEEIKSVFPIQPLPAIEHKVSHSTLFPITKPIDVKDFLEPPPPEKPETDKPVNEFDSKAFQRKRRIGIDLVNTNKKVKDEIEPESERKGFGFGGEENKSAIYTGFQKGGVLFVKSEKTEEEAKKEEITPKINQKELEETYSTLKEKLSFLSEGRPEVSPVQVMIIQAETLFTAMTEGGLKSCYLNKWLSETHADLLKLEKEATPDGWTMKWDRSHKRYYYLNVASGEGQWEYPQPDVLRCDEAMDISTTPPPVGSESTLDLSPPQPPRIRSPTPPPPPIINSVPEKEKVNIVPNIPLPVELTTSSQPLPPGVDAAEPSFDPPKEKPNDSLTTALDSFYSDIAAIENSNSPPPPPPPEDAARDTNDIDIKKKKKPKVKLAQGISMKKKGVSKLVEKWKNVQMSYDS